MPLRRHPTCQEAAALAPDELGVALEILPALETRFELALMIDVIEHKVAPFSTAGFWP